MTNMMPTLHFNNHGITCCQAEPFRVEKEILTSIFEPDFNDVEFIFPWHIHIGQPVKDVHLITATSITSTVIVTARDRSILG
jgi:hypothetical protein